MNLIWSYRQQAFYREGPGGFYTPHPALARRVSDQEAVQISGTQDVQVVPVSTLEIEVLDQGRGILTDILNRVS